MYKLRCGIFYRPKELQLPVIQCILRIAEFKLNGTGEEVMPRGAKGSRHIPSILCNMERSFHAVRYESAHMNPKECSMERVHTKMIACHLLSGAENKF